MLRRSYAHYAAVLLAVPAIFASTSKQAFADPLPSIDLRRFSPSPDPRALLFLEPADTPARWQIQHRRMVVVRLPAARAS
ncbi:MAG: hypothetical protein U0165_18795 [Polyangiaceae bacterium]